jgi:AbrB family looped-hinge helix DNA binding protein
MRNELVWFSVRLPHSNGVSCSFTLLFEMSRQVKQMTTLTVTARGQVTVRKEVLQHLGIRPGEKIELDKGSDGTVTLRPRGHVAR